MNNLRNNHRKMKAEKSNKKCDHYIDKELAYIDNSIPLILYSK